MSYGKITEKFHFDCIQFSYHEGKPRHGAKEKPSLLFTTFRKRRILPSFTVLAISWISVIHGQDSRGTIAGQINDSTGATVPNAQITVSNQASGTTITARSNESGNYAVPFLLPGVYAVSVELAGFKQSTRRNIEVRVGDNIKLDIEMSVGDVAERVEVTAAAPLLESSSVSLGQVVDQRRLTELPVQAGTALELVMLSPGVASTTPLRVRRTSFNTASSQFSTDGNAQYSNEFTIDGIPNTFATGSEPRVAFQPPQAAVAEFKVQTAAYDAGVGHSPGAVVNIITSGGTNQFHGSLHEVFSNAALDAPTFFQNRSGAKKPVYQDNRFGAAIGGPVLLPKLYNGRNRTFFFYSWEANTWAQPRAVVGTVPTAQQKQGDLSSLLALGSAYQIYDPFTTRDNGNGRFSRQPVPGNIIPASRIDPVAKNIMTYWANPNTAGTREGRNNYTQNNKDLEDYFVHFARVDHSFSQNNRMYLRVDYDHWQEDKQDFYSNLSSGVLLDRINRGLALDDVMVLSPSSVLNVRYGITQEEAPERRRSHGFDNSKLGFSPSLLSLLNKNLQTFPNVFLNTAVTTSPCSGSCTGTYSGFAAWESGDGANTGIIHSFNATMSTLKKNHNLRYGADLRVYRAFQNRLGYDVSPALQFVPTYTRGPLDNSPVAPIGQEFAAFLFGIPDGEMRRSASFATQEKFASFFLQDDWKLSKRLTLNMGLRYEYESPLTERFDRSIRGFDYTASSPIEAQARANYARNPIPEISVSQFRAPGGLLFAGGSNGRSLWDGQKGNLLPRIGIAWQLDDKTVIRTGFGLFYDSIGTNRSPAIQTGYTASTPIIASLNNGLNYVATTANPFPNGLLAPLGSSEGLATNLGQSLTVYPRARVQPYAQRWSFGMQRQLPGQTLLEASYVGNKGIRLQVARELNFTDPKYLSISPERDQRAIDFLSQQSPSPFAGINKLYTSNISRANLLKPYPQFGSIRETEPNGYSWYHALQSRVERRFSRGYTFQGAYTWSKAMDATQYLNEGDYAPARSIAQFDRTHVFVLSSLWELPFGRGRSFGANMSSVLNTIVGGWQLNTIYHWQSGNPLTFGNVILRGNLKDVPLSGNQRSVDRWFNVDLFERAAARQLQNNIRTFPLRFSNIRSDAQTKLDISVIKYFNLTERLRLQFRAEAFNSLNHVNFNAPNMAVTGTAFGTVTGQGSLSRQFQGVLKIVF